MEDIARLLKSREPTLVEHGSQTWFRTQSSGRYPSVTNILRATESRDRKAHYAGQTAQERFLRKHAEEVGHQTHELLDDYFSGTLDAKKFGLYPLAHFENLKPYLENVSDVVCTEQKMCSEELGMGGTPDLIARYRGELSVIDYKTKTKFPAEWSMHESYLQATGYAQVFESVTGQGIGQVVILVSSADNRRGEFVRRYDDHLDEMNQRRGRFLAGIR